MWLSSPSNHQHLLLSDKVKNSGEMLNLLKKEKCTARAELLQVPSADTGTSPYLPGKRGPGGFIDSATRILSPCGIPQAFAAARMVLFGRKVLFGVSGHGIIQF